MAIVPFHPSIQVTFPQSARFQGGSYGLNALNENGAIMGRLFLDGGVAGPKTLSAAGGGRIIICVGTATWATAPSELRVGLEDLAATGLGDGTQDVYGARIAGTTPITALSYNTWLMTSGTKTVNAGDLLAITIRMPARAGADSVNIASFLDYQTYTTSACATALPYGAANSAKGSEMLWAFIIFDDGTYGWIEGLNLTQHQSSLSLGGITNVSAPNELCGTFKVKVPTQLRRIGWMVTSAAAADDFSLVLYRDPYATYIAEQVVAIDSGAHTNDGASSVSVNANITPYTCVPGTVYGVGFRPTTANPITIYTFDLGSGFSYLKVLTQFLTEVKLAGRNSLVTPFVEIQPHYMPMMSVDISGFDDGAGSGGSGARSYGFAG